MKFSWPGNQPTNQTYRTWLVAIGSSTDVCLTITSPFIAPDAHRRWIARKFTHKLLVLNKLKFEVDKKFWRCCFGTSPTSKRRVFWKFGSKRKKNKRKTKKEIKSIREESRAQQQQKKQIYFEWKKETLTCPLYSTKVPPTVSALVLGTTSIQNSVSAKLVSGGRQKRRDENWLFRHERHTTYFRTTTIEEENIRREKIVYLKYLT